MLATKLKGHLADLAALLLALILTGFYFSGIQSVPFHPDESTTIFMSGDVELFFQNPSQLYWSPEKSQDVRQIYRLLDAPLARWMIGIGRAFVNLPATPMDWNWSKTWTENEDSGALPNTDLLITARSSFAWLFPLSLIFIYLCGKKLGGALSGLTALLLLAGNALVLLHTRRAMAEPVLLFTVILALWSMFSLQKRLWLLAIPVALAFCAKQTGVAMILAGFVILIVGGLKLSRGLLIRNIAIFFGLAGLVTVILNPFIWSDPFSAVRAAFEARQDLFQRQVAEIGQAIPGEVLQTTPERALGLVANLFYTPLQFAETGNYLSQLQPEEANYLANPAQSLMRSPVGGSIFLFMSLAGFCIGLAAVWKRYSFLRRNLAILILVTVLFALVIILAFPFSFQRYSIPMVPLSILWIAYFIDRLAFLVIPLFSSPPGIRKA